MNPFEQHDASWHDRLQDLLDGDLQSHDRATIESHLATCARCRAHYSRLKRLDAKLSTRLGSIGLEASFEHQIFARIDALDARARERARRQADRELRENLQALTRSWRRGMAFLIGGAIAGIALALALMSWANAAGIWDKVLVAAVEFGGNDSEAIRTVLIALIGAGIGGGISRWLAATLE